MSTAGQPIELIGACGKVRVDPWGKTGPWDEVVAHSFHCHICIITEVEGGYSAIVLNLPGVGSCGDTKDEAVANAKEAVAGAIESYREMGEDIPWINSLGENIPEGAEQTWILVDA